LPSRPGEFHPEPLTEPDVILSHRHCQIRVQGEELHCEVETTGGVCVDGDKIRRLGFRTPPNHQDQAVECQRRINIPTAVQFGDGRSGLGGYLGNVG